MIAKGDKRLHIKVVASPLRHKKCKSVASGGGLGDVACHRTFKHPGGHRKLLIKTHQMELEVSTLKRRYMASRDTQKKMKADMREQRDQTLKIISRVAQVLEEKENQIQELHAQKESELSKIARELLYLQSNMLKERTRLQDIISELTSKVSSQDSEIKKLKKKLQLQKSLTNNKTSIIIREDSPTSDLETLSPSSEESSPKSTLSNKMESPKNNSDYHSIIHSAKNPSGAPPATNPSSRKPPIPSRIGVNRKINNRLKELKLYSKDEGFFSSYEEPPLSFGATTIKNSPHPNAKRAMSFQHESRVKSISTFGTLEELNVTSQHQNEKTPTTIIRYLDYL